MKVFELRKEVGCGDRMASQITIMLIVFILSKLYNNKKKKVLLVFKEIVA